ncbi:ATP-binding protein [Mycobacterium sp. M26]|uniref:sensor histidine kinase n=1 Tax=Mycobacterium sp. M26 TaxID=1762962 RepID=UPI00073E50F4|nr:ATP-binding protein [Mycobacterium sp. M26]
MRQNGSRPTRSARFLARLAIPPTPSGGEAHDAVQAVFLRFERQAQRRRSVLRLLLIAVMVLAILAGTERSTWPAQFTIVGVYAALAIISVILNVRRQPGGGALRGAAPMMFVDIAAICLLQLPSLGSVLMLGLLAFLPFFLASQSGRLGAVMAMTAIALGGLTIVTDSTLRREMSALQIATVLLMLALLCVCSYAVSAVQQHRMTRFAELIASRSMLLADVMTAEERQRRQVAEDLHDGPLQTVLAARQDLREVVREHTDLPSVTRASELLGDVSRELRQLTKELHPSVLEEGGLEPAVRGLLDSLVERTGATVDCEIDYPRRHPEDATLYGVARELLSNIARHANADTVWLSLKDGGDIVTLDVRDNGVGIDPGIVSRRVAEGHIGLASHRSRIETLRGSWEFEPVEQGTWVRVTLPVHNGKEVR